MQNRILKALKAEEVNTEDLWYEDIQKINEILDDVGFYFSLDQDNEGINISYYSPSIKKVIIYEYNWLKNQYEKEELAEILNNLQEKIKTFEDNLKEKLGA